MNSDSSLRGSSTDEFGFNNSDFSDRLLRIEITASDHLDGDNQQNLTDPGGDNLDDEGGEAITEEVLSGTGGDEEEDQTEMTNWGMECSRVIRVKESHVSSRILAAKSPFFDKLFTNGMKESDQTDVTLRINESEEAAFMELLKFMHTNVVSVDTTPALLDVLIAADKFEVPSCIGFCCKLLRNLPLTYAAKQFLASHFKDITKYQEEVLFLPLAAIEAILSSDDLQVESEDEVYEFILKWARVNYPLLEERREILGSRLSRLIRFPFMTYWTLGTLVTCPDFEPKVASKLVQETLFFKGGGGPLNMQPTTLNRCYIERAYKFKPIKVIQVEIPNPECLVFMNLKREECTGLFPSGQIVSEPFYLQGKRFNLLARCNMNKEISFECFGLFLGIEEQCPADSLLEFEFLAMSKTSSEHYKSKFRFSVVGQETVRGDLGCRNLFEIPWTSFIGDDSEYFINDILRLSAEITIKKLPLRVDGV